MTEPWWTTLTTTDTHARGRRHTLRALVSTTIAALLSGAAVGIALAGPRTPESTTEEFVTYTRPGIQALAAGCGPLAQVPTPSKGTGWVPDRGNVMPYDTTVPVSGWFFEQPPTEDDISPLPEAVVREMYDGRKIAWYADDAPEQIINQLHALADQNPQWNLRVTQWPSERGERLPAQVAFATWGATQSCDQVLPEIAEAVWAAGTPAPGTRGEVPMPYGSER